MPEESGWQPCVITKGLGNFGTHFVTWFDKIYLDCVERTSLLSS